VHPRLVGIAGPFQGMVVPLPEGETLIGRDPANQIWISDGSLSRRHCVVARRGADIAIRDLGSRNGTRVNGMPVEERLLENQDQISVGSSFFVFLQNVDATPSGRNQVEFQSTISARDLAFLVRKEDTASEGNTAAFRPSGRPGTSRVAGDLNSLLKIALAIGSIRDQESLPWQLLGFLFDVVPAERGAVLLTDTAAKIVSTTAWDRLNAPDHPVVVDQGLVQKVLQLRMGVALGGAQHDNGQHEVTPPTDEKIRSQLCVPLAVSDRALGVLYLDSANPAVLFDRNHLQLVSAVGSIAALALENLRHWEKVEAENQVLRAEMSLEHDMVGNSPRIREVFEFIRRVAPTDSTVLIQGESGTGKELVARAVHRNSPRAAQTFVAINCAAIAETLLESELFGHEKGAFTGAAAQKKGKVEVADGGTLFLDEILELAPALQAKLLRVLQEREFERVGGTRPIPLDIRLIAASNKSLAEAVEQGQFRKDLFYRLNVVTVNMPPLRERREDIPGLANHFVAKAGRKCNVRPKAISAEAVACLANYDWPGNVRELENAMERALVLGGSDAIQVEDLPEDILEAGSPSGDTANFLGALKDFKKQLISQALRASGGSYQEAAKALGIHPNSLLRLMRNLNMKASSKAAPGESRGEMRR